MTLRLYDTQTRTVREFTPLVPGRASIYVCGATVQGHPHIGHVRSSIAFDVLRRWLQANGYQVTFVRNVTDIDDKILRKAAAAGRPWWQWAATYERAFDDAYRQLGVLPPAIQPHATGHIPQMIDLVQRLIDAGHAYAARGNVYFAVVGYPEYGHLSRHRLDEVDQGEPTGDNDSPGKRDTRDFTLWKAAKHGEPSWDAPWGPGRPGWHLECSAMAGYYLGAEFDIHGGGMDLVFPHHENEQAQSRAAGDGFARYWLHNGLVTLAGGKMSKSLGNTLSVPTVLKLVRPVELRYYLGSAHYSSSLEYSEDALRDAAAAYQRLAAFVHRVARHGDVPVGGPTAGFADALDDNLAVPKALAEVHAVVHTGNTALESGATDLARECAGQVRAMLAILGMDPLDPHWASGSDAGSAERALNILVQAELDQRNEARAQRDWATADAVRDRLARAGIQIDDTSAGAQWSLRDRTVVGQR